MRKSLFLGMVMLLACSVAYGTPYTYVGGAHGPWGTSTNWNPVGVPGEGDCASLTMGGNVVVSGTITCSQLIVDNGATLGNGASGWGGSYNLVVTDNGGNTSGDLIWKSGALGPRHSGMVFNWDIAGHCIYERTNSLKWNFPSAATNKVILRGENKAYKSLATYGHSLDFDVCEIHGSYFDNGSVTGPYQSSRTVVVKSGGAILARPDSVASEWLARKFVFEGGQANLPAYGSQVHFDYQCSVGDNGAGKLTVAGGVTYPWNVSVGQQYWGSPTPKITPYLWQITGGAMTVAQDLLVGSGGGQADAHLGIWLDTTDGVNATSNNLTVNRDLSVSNVSYSAFERYGLKMNASQVRVGGNLTVNGAAALDMGSATVRLGGNLSVTNQTAWGVSNWSAGTSTLICDGNGLTGILQTLTLAGNPLHTLEVDTDCGVALGGDLTLTGDLTITDGDFNANGREITFNGDPHYFQAAGGATYDLDNVVLLENAVLYLLSDMTIDMPDNLVMLSGSKLYLNGWTLYAEGQTLVSADITTVPWDDGTIYGTGVIPEPGTMLLVGTGVLCAMGYIRRRRMK